MHLQRLFSSRRGPRFLLLAAVLFAVPAAACGSTVVAPSGAGGIGAGGDTGEGGTSACLSFPSPVSSVISCGTSGQVGAGGSPSECGRCRKDQGGNTYRAACLGADCTCTYSPGDGTTDIGCSCTMTGECKNANPNCCPQFD